VDVGGMEVGVEVGVDVTVGVAVAVGTRVAIVASSSPSIATISVMDLRAGPLAAVISSWPVRSNLIAAPAIPFTVVVSRRGNSRVSVG
jgi:hypothetical protein